MDLVRKIRFAVEGSETGWAPSPIEFEGFTDEQVGYHVLLAIEAGLITGEDTTRLNGPPEALAGRLTWSGYEFLDAARDDTRWNDAKRTIGTKTGALSFTQLTDLLMILMRRQVGFER
jgi:hypothetical protein